MAGRRMTIIIMGGFFLSGLAALMYEVIWTRALALVLGNTVYAMSVILSTFMGGLAIGSLAGGRLSDGKHDHLRLLGICELVIGLFGIITIPIIYLLPQVYLALYRAMHLSPKLFMLSQMLLCSGVMLVPTVMMGMTFPLVTKIVTDTLAEVGKKVGWAYFWNTVGAVIGSLLSGFALVPLLGIKGATLVTAGINIVVGLILVGFSRGSLSRTAGIIAIPLVLGTYWNASASQGTHLVNYYSAYRNLNKLPYAAIAGLERRDHNLVFSGEYPEGDVKVFRQDDGTLLLQVGGKLEGTSMVDMDNTLLLTYLPLASHPAPEDVLVIGLGAGVTVGAAKDQKKRVDLVEINPGVVKAIEQVGRPGLLDGVGVIKDDARNYLFYNNKKYDVISSEPSYPSESAVAGLFTREYYKIAAQRLKPQGVYCQWLPYYMLSNDEITMMLKTFVSVFPHSYLWKVTSSMDLILVGGLEPITIPAEQIMDRVAAMNGANRPLVYTLSRNPEQLREIARRPEVPINTDDRPLLEFATADNFVLGDLSIKDRR